MKKTLVPVALAAIILSSATLPSCIGTFALSNKLLTWNRSISNKFVNELVFLAFWILPVYEVSGAADLLVLNTIEFWSGENPVACGTKRVKGNDGTYLVKSDKKGYTITSETDGTSVRLSFNSKDKSWSMALPDGSEQVLFTFVDDTHISLPTPAGECITVETSQAGLYAYSQIAMGTQLAAR